MRVCQTVRPKSQATFAVSAFHRPRSAANISGGRAAVCMLTVSCPDRCQHEVSFQSFCVPTTAHLWGQGWNIPLCHSVHARGSGLRAVQVRGVRPAIPVSLLFCTYRGRWLRHLEPLRNTRTLMMIVLLQKSPSERSNLTDAI